MSDLSCESCVESGLRGYCALGRCYCGHATCAAFLSWYPLPPPIVEPPAPHKPSRASSWDTREESTWIDQL